MSALSRLSVSRFSNLARFSTTSHLQAGHSKWQNIKHTKARNDAKRSKTNTRVASMITVAAREGGGPDPTKNMRLATMIESALRANIPRRVIDGAVARAAPSTTTGANLTSVTYEGVGPGGVAVIVEALTDNRNRTAQNIRAAFTRAGGSLAPVAFRFQRLGYVTLGTDLDQEALLEEAIELGALDLDTDGEGRLRVLTEPTELNAVTTALKKTHEIEEMGQAYVPVAELRAEGLSSEHEQQFAKLIDSLEELEDVCEVYHNREASA